MLFRKSEKITKFISKKALKFLLGISIKHLWVHWWCTMMLLNIDVIKAKSIITRIITLKYPHQQQGNHQQENNLQLTLVNETLHSSQNQ